MVDPAQLAWGLADAAVRLGRPDPRATPGARRSSATAPACGVRTPYGSVRAAPRRAGDQRVPVAAAPGPPVRRRRSGTTSWSPSRCRAEQLASIGWDEPAGHRRRRQPVPLLPADRRRPDPVGRLRRGLPLRQRPMRRRARAATGDLRAAGRALLRDVPAAGGPALHPRLGRRHRHLHAGSAPFWGTAYGGRVGLRRRLHRARGRARRRFGAQVLLDLLDGRRHRA